MYLQREPEQAGRLAIELVVEAASGNVKMHKNNKMGILASECRTKESEEEL